MHLARTIVVSSFVLLSSTMLADVVDAEEGAQLIEFECDVPMTGSARCGSPNRNVRVNGNKKLSVQVSSMPSNVAVQFTVYHAVDKKELVTSKEIRAHEVASQLWPNLKDEGVDVYMTVRCTTWDAFTIKGTYIIN